MMRRIGLPLGIGLVFVFATHAFGRISATSLTYPNMRQMQLGFKLIF